MVAKTVLVIGLLSLAGPAFAQNEKVDANAGEKKFERTTHSYLPLVVDPNLTMRAGTENLVTLQHYWSRYEDAYLGFRWFSEKRLVGKSAGLGLRLAKYALLDLPVDYFTVVLGHEYLGHGARYRELNVGDVDYGFDLPPPYGAGGGQASVSIEGNVLSDHEVLAIWMGGMESHPLITRRLGLRWMARQRIHYREASLYFWSWQILFTYVNDSEEDLSAISDENDPQAYVRILNSHAGYADLSDLRFTMSDLKSKSALSAANPFLLYSLFTLLKSYLFDGNTASSLPTIGILGASYLPALRTALTPFGPEYHLENYIRVGDRVALIDLRKGDPTFYESWGGLGASVQNVYAGDVYSVDARLEIWKQPALELGPKPSVPTGGGWGGAGSLRGYYDFETASLRLSWLGEIGYKSVGFLEGYALDAGPVVLIGIAIRD